MLAHFLQGKIWIFVVSLAPFSGVVLVASSPWHAGEVSVRFAFCNFDRTFAWLLIRLDCTLLWPLAFTLGWIRDAFPSFVYVVRKFPSEFYLVATLMENVIPFLSELGCFWIGLV